MDIQPLLQEIETTLTTVFTKVDTWFDTPEEMRTYRPATSGWTINEILEHIYLTSFYLLKLIDKGATKALKNTKHLDLSQELATYTFNREKLNEIGIHTSFPWIRPAHMEPTGKMPLSEVRIRLQEQKNKCLEYLYLLPNGEGVLCKTTMSVNNLGKLDVYAYIYFLAQHAQRHITQMKRNQAGYREFLSSSEKAD